MSSVKRALILALLLAHFNLSSQECSLKAKNQASLSHESKPAFPCELEWQILNEKVEGRLIKIQPPLAIPASSKFFPQEIHSPFFLRQQAGATQFAGWWGAWTRELSTYAVAAETVQDVVEAVNFARAHQLKLIIKGTGHDLMGRSNAKDSLLLWTYPMRQVAFVKRFRPAGAPDSVKAGPAVTVEAGACWLEVYQEVISRQGRYVQGAQCTSAGAIGGFLQSGGFGSFSKKFGLAAASLLEAEVVTAEGEVITANAYQNQDLFWALKGGGGGTFAIVLRATLKTHKLPKTVGRVEGTISTHSGLTFKNLLKNLLCFCKEQINNEHWGEWIKIKGNNSIEVALAFQGLTKEQASEIWKPFLDSIKKNGYFSELKFSDMPAKKMWNYGYLKKNFPELICSEPRNIKARGQFWWSVHSSDVSKVWYTYQSRWLPAEMFEKKQFKRLAELLFKAARLWEGGVELHFNKGLAGASSEASKGALACAINPKVLDAAALIIMKASALEHVVDLKDQKIDSDEVHSQVKKVGAAMQLFATAFPNSGCYFNESDYFLNNWQEEYWGIHYERLLKIKQRYDPNNFFHCHHGVGSELN